MSFFDRLFLRKKNNYSSLYPDKVKGLTDQQKSRFDLIATSYKRLSISNSKLPYLQQAFFDRYQKARMEGVKLDIFFHAEEEALDIYKKKMESTSTQTKEAFKQNLPEQVRSMQKIKNGLIDSYPKASIHKKASPNMERLYGALLVYEKKFSKGLQQATKLITEAEFHEIVYGVVYGLEDFTHSNNKILPFVFSQYSFDLEKEIREPKQSENEILAKLSILLDKVEKAILWSKRVNLTNIANNPFSQFIVGNDRLNFNEFFDALSNETNKLIKAFGLDSYSKPDNILK